MKNTEIQYIVVHVVVHLIKQIIIKYISLQIFVNQSKGNKNDLQISYNSKSYTNNILRKKHNFVKKD